ncbi:uncharacterized protein RJT21DRAFT_15182 [Scheffersomyces amazonensis]|uniref:uncharacterized protein n=1 Tax=Scheffersomyces amazonensis TaxID=1078765 RepID=UPI00315D02CD
MSHDLINDNPEVSDADDNGQVLASAKVEAGIHESNDPELEQAHNEHEHNQDHEVEEEAEEEDDDDDFGSFDDASFEESQQAELVQSPATETGDPVQHKVYLPATFTEDVFDNEVLFSSNLSKVLDSVFVDDESHILDQTASERGQFLTERSEIIFNQLSNIPHLRPSNWTRSNIRHNLLIRLGIPVNLDEINNQEVSNNQNLTVPTSNTTQPQSRRKSISAKDISWDGYEIPDFAGLNITNEEKQDRLKKTNEILSRIETENMDHSSRQFLELHDEDKFIQVKLQQLRENYAELQALASCWIDNMNELNGDFEIYENVVQNLVGYSQRLRRDEIFDNLKKVKQKKGSKRKLWR